MILVIEKVANGYIIHTGEERTPASVNVFKHFYEVYDYAKSILDSEPEPITAPPIPNDDIPF